MTTPRTLGNPLLGLILVGCAAAGQGGGSEEEDLVGQGDGKEDTGYYSNLATELEGEIRSVLVLEANDEARRALEDKATQERLVTEQVKFAKNQLNAEKLHLNLTAGEVTVADAAEEGGKVVLRFTMR